MKMLKIPFPLPSSIVLCKLMKKVAKTALKTAELDKYRNHKLREEFQFELQAKYKDCGNKKMADTIKQLNTKKTIIS